MSPTSPTTPAGTGPSSVRAIVNWLETSGTSGTGAKRDKAGLPAVNRGGYTRTTGTLASSSPQAPSPKLTPLPAVVAPPRTTEAAPAAPAVSSPFGHSADPAEPDTSPTPALFVHRGAGALEDCSRTLLKHEACFRQPQSTIRDQQKNGTGESVAAVRNSPGKKKSYGDLGRSRTSSSKTAEELPERHIMREDGSAGAGNNRPRRHKEEVSAYWSSVRGYLFITDEEIYGS